MTRAAARRSTPSCRASPRCATRASDESGWPSCPTTPTCDPARRRPARGRHDRGRLGRHSDPGPASDAAGPARADPQRDQRWPVHPRHRHEPPHGDRADVGHVVGQSRSPDARVPRRPAAAAGRASPPRPKARFRTTRGALQIPGAPTPDVYLAALGPQMLRLAGRRTAGTLTWMTGPKTLAEHIGPALREAAAEAGRPESEVRVAASLPVSVTDDVDGARVQGPPRSSRSTGSCRPTARCWTARAIAGPEDAAIIGDEATVSDRLDELSGGGCRRVRGRRLRRVARGP